MTPRINGRSYSSHSDASSCHLLCWYLRLLRSSHKVKVDELTGEGGELVTEAPVNKHITICGSSLGTMELIIISFIQWRWVRSTETGQNNQSIKMSSSLKDQICLRFIALSCPTAATFNVNYCNTKSVYPKILAYNRGQPHCNNGYLHLLTMNRYHPQWFSTYESHTVSEYLGITLGH